MTKTHAAKLQVGAVLAAVAVISLTILQVSQAAFSDTTDSSGNWGSATVALSDDDGTAQVAFTNDTAMVPGDTDRACITVAYDGDVAADVKLYGSITSGDLGEYLDVTVEEVTIEGEDTCDTATVDSELYTGTLATNAGAFTGDHTNWDTGVTSTFAPSSNGETQIYRITVELQDADDAQGLTTEALFTWEAQNS